MVKRFEYADGGRNIVFMGLNVFSDETGCHKRKQIKVLITLCLIVLLFSLKYSGIADNIEIETIRAFIQQFGYIGPLVYILIVTIAPALMLPGAPFILAGGILFGSFWGVVYGITGATTGACLAFLVSRYLLRDWIESKLISPAWLKLKDQTEIHGWKIVAITRLVPLVPFNLLSYALGLTRIKFSQYALTSFICMLPGCIAYILLSESILEFIKGRITIEFIAAILILLILFLVMLYLNKRYSSK